MAPGADYRTFPGQVPRAGELPPRRILILELQSAVGLSFNPFRPGRSRFTELQIRGPAIADFDLRALELRMFPIGLFISAGSIGVFALTAEDWTRLYKGVGCQGFPAPLDLRHPK